ncbi:FAD-binding oxidoreductase [Spiractinospora alimapuensis]|uniref:NAD(P)/FAD-dependent oxidoreductase n=1 Tax=Spiractinospora alimapuensis TaxID=2820884 RepID=UPI001F3FEFC2|nr:FAD-dependent oxidoreductase [Spiractinospora alimapuensis]QVQ52346.1 FAD-binding oxidoreductase [Spiractinospora alimapuensis]
MRTVVVIGAGVVGASIAWNLALRGVRAVILEQADQVATATSGASFSRATAFGKTPAPYFALNHDGLRELHRLREDGVPGFHLCPSLVWTRDTDQLADDVSSARDRGYQAALVPAAGPHQPCRLSVASLPDQVAHLPHEGWVDLPVMSRWMVDQAWRHGADVRYGARVTALRTRPTGVVCGVTLEDGSVVDADMVVNAAGAQAQHVAGLVGAPLRLAPTPGLLVDVVTPGGLDAMVLGPDISVRPAGPRTVRLRSDAVDTRLASHVGPHPRGLDATPRRPLTSLVQELVERAAALLPGLRGRRPDAARVGVRAYPADGLPSVGTLDGIPGYYEAVTHSGASLGPLLGRHIAAAIATDTPVPCLAAYSPNRFSVEAPADDARGPAHELATEKGNP